MRRVSEEPLNSIGYLAKATGPQDVLATLLNNLKVQEQQNCACIAGETKVQMGLDRDEGSATVAAQRLRSNPPSLIALLIGSRYDEYQAKDKCPLCLETMDLTDKHLKPCKCGYEICLWCWHHIMEMDQKWWEPWEVPWMSFYP